MTVLRNYAYVEKNLNSVYNFLKSLNKKELSYRFNELDNFMKNNPFTSTSWEDFKKALMRTKTEYAAHKTLYSNKKSYKYRRF